MGLINVFYLTILNCIQVIDSSELSEQAKVCVIGRMLQSETILTQTTEYVLYSMYVWSHYGKSYEIKLS